jgi:hypothetical protein
MTIGPGLSVIKSLSTIFGLVLKNCPIRIKYLFEKNYSFLSTSTKIVLESVMTMRPGLSIIKY